MSFIKYVPGADTLNGKSNANGNESPEFETALSHLSPRQARFVKEYIAAGDNGAEAARRAGYTAKDAKKRSWLLMKRPDVQAAIAAARRDLAVNAQYDLAKAMTELEDAAAYAKSTNNATALTRAIELKARLCGLMIERIDQRRVGSFAVNIGGLD